MSEDVENHILKRYNLIKKVGSGAYGHVWKVNDRKTGQIFALKKIFDAFQHSTDAQRTYREIVLLHQLDHQNIVKLYDVIRADNDKDLYLVFEYMEADLHNAISQKILKDIHNRFIIYQLAKGIKFLHSAQVVHRDLKPSNILLNSDCLLKICDFGLARSLVSDEASDIIMTEQVATRWYRSPQVLLGSHNYDKSADIWSIGCILAEMLIEKPIFPGTSTLNQLQRILSFTGRPKKQDINSLNSQIAYSMIDQLNEIKQKSLNEWFKPQVPKDALNLVYKLLQFNPEKRLNINEILLHPYLAKFHNPKQEVDSKKIIRPPVSDNQKLNLKQYRLLIYERIREVYHHTYNQNKVQPDNKQNNYSTSKQKPQLKQGEPRYSNTREKSFSKQLNKAIPQKTNQSSIQNYTKQANKNNGSVPKNLPTNMQQYLPQKYQSINYDMFNKSYQQKANENLVTQNQKYQSHQSSIQKHRPSSIVMRESNKYQSPNTNYNYQKNNKPSQQINNFIIKNQNITEEQNVKRKNSLKQMRRTKNSSPSLKQNYNIIVDNKINTNFNQTCTNKFINQPQYTRNYSTTISYNNFTPINNQIKHHTNNLSGYQQSKFINNYNINQHLPTRY